MTHGRLFEDGADDMGPSIVGFFVSLLLQLFQKCWEPATAANGRFCVDFWAPPPQEQ